MPQRCFLMAFWTCSLMAEGALHQAPVKAGRLSARATLTSSVAISGDTAFTVALSSAGTSRVMRRGMAGVTALLL